MIFSVSTNFWYEVWCSVVSRILLPACPLTFAPHVLMYKKCVYFNYEGLKITLSSEQSLFSLIWCLYCPTPLHNDTLSLQVLVRILHGWWSPLKLWYLYLHQNLYAFKIWLSTAKFRKLFKIRLGKCTPVICQTEIRLPCFPNALLGLQIWLYFRLWTYKFSVAGKHTFCQANHGTGKAQHSYHTSFLCVYLGTDRQTYTSYAT